MARRLDIPLPAEEEAKAPTATVEPKPENDLVPPNPLETHQESKTSADL